ncbi:predicted protein [Streptomyces pristinaespiralis ATCC 25486]|uniref:Predicted protein n=1 Tax=Streptomyces pristinaespiralis (strain ATCC 25486 / DSM 40338 / CBS 914.69 / JCM 4507 / KCC S-0507 / NBRC 13074 / NRRL 2958 / 5647) TaxID=457429 RepID=D6X6Q4_STRE2|nr:predicted protein [Streptomyces pristinaespiralis ATCC 25486]
MGHGVRVGAAGPGPPRGAGLRRHPVLLRRQDPGLPLPGRRSADIHGVLDFAETFLGGGTSCQRPLTVASDLFADAFDDAAPQAR